MRYVGTLIVVLFLSGCGAANVEQLMQEKPHTVTAQSPDDVPTTVRRISAGLQQCYDVPVAVEYFTPYQPADVTIDGGPYARTLMNSRVTPSTTGSVVTTVYATRAWAKNARAASRLAEGQPPDC